jgi:hypothetical protein
MNTTSVVHVIDCDVSPFVPDKRWKVVSHRQHGLFEWNQDAISFLTLGFRVTVEKGHRLTADWMIGKYWVDLEKLKARIEASPVLNANVLDYLILHPELIPDKWKKERGIIFYGTIYNFCGDCARFLRWRAGKWDWNYVSISGKWGHDFDGPKIRYPAAAFKT